MRIAVTILVALAASGCATTPAMTKFSKPGATYDDYLRDRFECIQPGRTRVAGGYMSDGKATYSSGEAISRGMVVSCMAARGYRVDPNGYEPPEGASLPAR